MAFTAQDNEDHSRPVAVSSTSSLETFAASIPVSIDDFDIRSNQVPLSPEESLTSAPPQAVPSMNENLPASAVSSIPDPLSSQASQAPVPIMPSTSAQAIRPSQASTASGGSSVAEFLYQLTKMLTDDNSEIIEWSNGKIEVHSPHRLESDVLHKYFRHSKFASFQRQLNYFGFRKLAGKGKMAPCSYVNDAATPDLRSLLLIKRKATPVIVKEKSKREQQRERGNSTTSTVSATPPVNPVLAGILQRSNSTGANETKAITAKVAAKGGIKHAFNGFLQQKEKPPAANAQAALARSAVGKGIKHNYSNSVASAQGTEAPSGSATAAIASNHFTFKDPHQLGMDVETSLSQLSTNYLNSLKASDNEGQGESPCRPCYGMLSRDSSLVDLAMLHPVEPTPVGDLHSSTSDQNLMQFVDFPDDFDPTISSGAKTVYK